MGLLMVYFLHHLRRRLGFQRFHRHHLNHHLRHRQMLHQHHRHLKLCYQIQS
jgi:hypothetical protein